LRSETAFGSDIYDEEHLPFVGVQRGVLAVNVLDGDVVDRSGVRIMVWPEPGKRLRVLISCGAICLIPRIVNFENRLEIRKETRKNDE